MYRIIAAQPAITADADVLVTPAAGKHVSPGLRLYQRQVKCLISGDVNHLVDENYAEDALLTSAFGTVRGKAALKEHFEHYLQRVQVMGVKSTDVFVETEATILFEATMETSQGLVKVYDAMVLRDGKITCHFSGVK